MEDEDLELVEIYEEKQNLDEEEIVELTEEQEQKFEGGASVVSYSEYGATYSYEYAFNVKKGRQWMMCVGDASSSNSSYWSYLNGNPAHTLRETVWWESRTGGFRIRYKVNGNRVRFTKQLRRGYTEKTAGKARVYVLASYEYGFYKAWGEKCI